MICYDWSIIKAESIIDPSKSDVSPIIICQLNKLQRKCVIKTNVYFLLKLIVGALSAIL